MPLVTNSANSNLQSKRPRLEDQGDHEMDMFERKSQMQVLFFKLSAKNVTFYSNLDCDRSAQKLCKFIRH